MQQRESGEHHRSGGVGQHEQAGRVHEHAESRNHALLVAVADGPADEHTADLRHHHQGDDQGRFGDAIAQAFLHVRDRVHIDRVDDQQGKAVAQRQQPESAGAQRLARAELRCAAGSGAPGPRPPAAGRRRSRPCLADGGGTPAPAASRWRWRPAPMRRQSRASRKFACSRRSPERTCRRRRGRAIAPTAHARGASEPVDDRDVDRKKPHRLEPSAMTMNAA